MGVTAPLVLQSMDSGTTTLAWLETTKLKIGAKNKIEVLNDFVTNWELFIS
jgi:hypothetical protein